MTPAPRQVPPDAHCRLLASNYVTGARLYLDLSYYRSDPFKVDMLIDDEVIWPCARTLLIEGCHRREGIGDIVVCPLNSVDLLILFRSPDGKLAMRVPLALIVTFLEDSCRAVPLGDEDQHMDWDQELKKLYTGDYGEKWRVDP